MKFQKQVLCDANCSEAEHDEDFILGVLLRVRVDNELRASDNWVDCPRCSGKMWRSDALCIECELE